MKICPTEHRFPGTAAPFRALVVSLYIPPYVSQYPARIYGFQILTVILAATGIYQLMPASRTITGMREVRS